MASENLLGLLQILFICKHFVTANDENQQTLINMLLVETLCDAIMKLLHVSDFSAENKCVVLEVINDIIKLLCHHSTVFWGKIAIVVGSRYSLVIARAVLNEPEHIDVDVSLKLVQMLRVSMRMTLRQAPDNECIKFLVENLGLFGQTLVSCGSFQEQNILLEIFSLVLQTIPGSETKFVSALLKDHLPDEDVTFLSDQLLPIMLNSNGASIDRVAAQRSEFLSEANKKFTIPSIWSLEFSTLLISDEQCFSDGFMHWGRKSVSFTNEERNINMNSVLIPHPSIQEGKFFFFYYFCMNFCF